MTSEIVTIEQTLELRYRTVLRTTGGTVPMPDVALSAVLSDEEVAALPEGLRARLTQYSAEAGRLARSLLRDAALRDAESEE